LAFVRHIKSSPLHRGSLCDTLRVPPAPWVFVRHIKSSPLHRGIGETSCLHVQRVDWRMGVNSAPRHTHTHAHTHTHTHTYHSLSISLSLIHTHTHTHTHPLFMGAGSPSLSHILLRGK